MKRWKTSILLVGLCLFPALALAAAPAPAPASDEGLVDPLTAAEDYGICREAPPTLDLVEEAAPLSQDCEMKDLDSIAAKKPKCQACPQQPWCECTYNGHSRISCDPCCYQTWAGPICTS